MKKLISAIKSFFRRIFGSSKPSKSISELAEDFITYIEETPIEDLEIPRSPLVDVAPLEDKHTVFETPEEEFQHLLRTNGIHELVLTARNKKNSIFYFRPKVEFEADVFANAENQPEIKTIRNRDLFLSPFEGFMNEEEIISMMGSGFIFWTFNPVDRNFTPIEIKGGHLRSPRNKTKADNISSLPIAGQLK
jgi:hypothetical protein